MFFEKKFLAYFLPLLILTIMMLTLIAILSTLFLILSSSGVSEISHLFVTHLFFNDYRNYVYRSVLPE